MGETLKTQYPVGSYSPGEIWRVLNHARTKRFVYETIAGPRKDFKLQDGTKITVLEGMTAVVLVSSEPKAVESFWDDFVFPDYD